ncbi:hypothetical protein [Rhizobium skierniewicense]|uniref:hypothetical protein n=1 Tax=Rhizobium skierniewicense TaxID=984260 RepID=UPI001F2F81A1|nr:hypothetical protein [Rhizobium skierniewicense]
MLKKLFAAAICGIVIASITSHADAAGPAGFARGFSALEYRVIASVAPLNSADRINVTRDQTMSAIDQYFSGFDQAQAAE